MNRILFGLLISFAANFSASEALNQEVKKQLVGLIESDDATQAFIMSHNNEIVHEFYGEDYTEDDLATSWSIAKTFYAALIGVAIEQDLITFEDLNKPLSFFIPELSRDVKADITLYNLLAMKTGLAITEYYNEEMFFSKDNLAFAMKVKPNLEQGVVYEYNNVNTMLLNPVIKTIFGKEPHEVLVEEIFEPLGIKKYGLWSDMADDDMTYCVVDL